MSERYQMRQGADGLWEVIDAVTGEIAKLGGMVLSGLDRDAAAGALDALLNQIITPNGEGSSGHNGA
jgi:hypothetical protein